MSKYAPRQHHLSVSKSKIAKVCNYKSVDISFVCIDVLNTCVVYVMWRRKVADYNPEEAYDVTKKLADDEMRMKREEKWW